MASKRAERKDAPGPPTFESAGRKQSVSATVLSVPPVFPPTVRGPLRSPQSGDRLGKGTETCARNTRRQRYQPRPSGCGGSGAIKRVTFARVSTGPYSSRRTPSTRSSITPEGRELRTKSERPPLRETDAVRNPHATLSDGRRPRETDEKTGRIVLEISRRDDATTRDTCRESVVWHGKYINTYRSNK